MKQILDFYLPDCGPCRLVEPIINKLAAENPSSLIVSKIDARSMIAKEFSVEKAPTIIFVDNGVEVERFVGLTPAFKLREAAARLKNRV